MILSMVPVRLILANSGSGDTAPGWSEPTNEALSRLGETCSRSILTCGGGDSIIDSSCLGVRVDGSPVNSKRSCAATPPVLLSCDGDCCGVADGMNGSDQGEVKL